MNGMIDTKESICLADLADRLGVTVEDILGHRRNAELVDARCMIVARLLNERPRMRQQDVAPLLDISQAAVSKLLARHHTMLSGYGRNSSYSVKWKNFQSRRKEDQNG